MPSTTTKKSTQPIQHFEKSMKKLNELVEKLESGNLPLDTALKHFEEGIQLVQTCQNVLTEAEQKVQSLTDKINAPNHD